MSELKNGFFFFVSAPCGWEKKSGKIYPSDGSLDSIKRAIEETKNNAQKTFKRLHQEECGCGGEITVLTETISG